MKVSFSLRVFIIENDSYHQLSYSVTIIICDSISYCMYCSNYHILGALWWTRQVNYRPTRWRCDARLEIITMISDSNAIKTIAYYYCNKRRPMYFALECKEARSTLRILVASLLCLCVFLFIYYYLTRWDRYWCVLLSTVDLCCVNVKLYMCVVQVDACLFCVLY